MNILLVILEVVEVEILLVGLLEQGEKGNCLCTKMVEYNGISAWMLNSNDTAAESWLCHLTNCGN